MLNIQSGPVNQKIKVFILNLSAKNPQKILPKLSKNVPMFIVDYMKLSSILKAYPIDFIYKSSQLFKITENVVIKNKIHSYEVPKAYFTASSLSYFYSFYFLFSSSVFIPLLFLLGKYKRKAEIVPISKDIIPKILNIVITTKPISSTAKYLLLSFFSSTVGERL